MAIKENKSKGLEKFTGESIEHRHAREDKRKNLLDTYTDLEKKGKKLDAKDAQWLLENVLFLPNEKPGPGILPKGNLRNKALGPEELQHVINIFYDNSAQSASTEKELLSLIQDHHPDHLFILLQKEEITETVRESIGKFQGLLNRLTGNKRQMEVDAAINNLRQQLSHLVQVIISLSTTTNVYDKSVYNDKEVKKLGAQYPHLYELKSVQGLHKLLISLTLSITGKGEDLFRSVLPKKSDTALQGRTRKFTPNERKHNLRKLSLLQESLILLDKGINRQMGLNQFNLHWFVDAYFRYLYTLKARIIYEISHIKYAEGTPLNDRKAELWKLLKTLNFLLRIKENLFDFKRLSRDLRDPKYRLNIMAGPSTSEILNAVNHCRRSNDFKEKEPDNKSYFTKGMSPGDLINMLMKQAVVFARIPFTRKHALLLGKIMEESVNPHVKLLGRRVIATIKETEFKYCVAASGAVVQYTKNPVESDLMLHQICPSEEMRSEKQRQEQRNLAKALFKYCAETIDTLAYNVVINSQSTVDPFRKVIWITDQAIKIGLLDQDFILLLMEKVPRYMDIMKLNNRFPMEIMKTDENGKIQRMNLNERFTMMADRGLKLTTELKESYKRLSRQAENRVRASETQKKTQIPSEPKKYKRRASDYVQDTPKETPGHQLYSDISDDDFKIEDLS